MSSAFKSSKETGLAVKDKILFWGPQHTGKTHASLTWPGVIMVDRENRAAHFADRVDFAHAQPENLDELAECYKQIRSGAIEGETVVTDSYSAIYDELVAVHTSRSIRGSYTTDYATVNKRITAVRDFAFSIGDKHVIFIAHAAQKYDRKGDQFSARGVDFVGDPRFRYAFDYVFRLEPTGADPRVNPVIFVVEKSASPNLKVGDRVEGLNYKKFRELTQPQPAADPKVPISGEQITTIEELAAELRLDGSRYRDLITRASNGRTTVVSELTALEGKRAEKTLRKKVEEVA